jgi:hypothetical protein
VARKQIALLDTAAQNELATWLAENAATLPAPVRIALEQHAAFLEVVQGSERRISALARELRRAMGLAASSERRPSQRPSGRTALGPQPRPQSQREKLMQKLVRSVGLAKMHRDMARKHGSDIVRTQNKLDNLPPDEPADSRTDADWTPEEAAELEAEHQAMLARCQLGEGTERALQSVTETLLAGGEVTTREEVVPLAAPEPNEGAQVLDTRVEERVRYDFSIVVGRVVAEVEKKVVVESDGRRRMLSASTRSIGPPRIGVTWRFLVNVVVMVVQYAMPMNRLAQLLSTPDKQFTSATLSRLLRYVAEQFAPIYLQLFDELADAEILMGDDTSPRVLEVRRHFAKGASIPPPWADYRTRDAAEETRANAGPSLEVILARELGFESARRDGDGPKRSLNTTVVAGRSDANEPESLIVFYRSHLGSLGNLLELLLERRNPKAGGVTVQSDLASTNLVSDAAILERFPIVRVGCASHARRPFAIHEADDEELCGIMLHYFKGLFIYEDLLDGYGRNRTNVSAVRDVDHRALWNDIRRLASLMERKWSRETKLGEAARYILRNFDALTAYLDDPRLDPTNNFSERMLRLEKLIEASSMFRATLGGRFVLDILRTVMQTAVAARAPLQEYLLSVLQTDPAEIAAAPERFTPHAWMREYGDALRPADDHLEHAAAAAADDDDDDESADPLDDFLSDTAGDDDDDVAIGGDDDPGGSSDDADNAVDFNIDSDLHDELMRDLAAAKPTLVADDLFDAAASEDDDEAANAFASTDRVTERVASPPRSNLRPPAPNKRTHKRRKKRRR